MRRAISILIPVFILAAFVYVSIREPQSRIEGAVTQASVEPVAEPPAQKPELTEIQSPTGHAIRPVLRPPRASGQSSGGAIEKLAIGTGKVGSEQRHRLMAASAVPLNSYQGPEDQIVTRMSGFAVLAGGGPPGADAVMHDDRRPVVWNQDGRRAEIVSGTYVVQLQNADLGPAVAARHGLKVLSADPSIKTVYLRMPDGHHVFAGEKALRADPAVVNVEVEMLGGGRQAR